MTSSTAAIKEGKRFSFQPQNRVCKTFKNSIRGRNFLFPIELRYSMQLLASSIGNKSKALENLPVQTSSNAFPFPYKEDQI